MPNPFVTCCLVLLACAPPSHAHDWYSGITNKNGASCCGGSDCGPLALEEVTERADGSFVVVPSSTRQNLIKGVRILFPKELAQPTRHWDAPKPGEEPESGYHACVGSSMKPLCLFYPTGA